MLFFVMSCKQKLEQNMDIIFFGTEDFNVFEQNAVISRSKAWKLQKQFLIENKMDTIGRTLYFIVDKNYIFSDYAKLKLNQASLRGISVHSETGNVKLSTNNIMITDLKSTGWRGDIE